MKPKIAILLDTDDLKKIKFFKEEWEKADCVFMPNYCAKILLRDKDGFWHECGQVVK